MLDFLKKGFGYVLMCMGVSSPVKKPGPKPATAAGAARGGKKAD